ncbi:hypothetical protein PTTG_25610 [Puccinia triticina 1-1 BBBD Race 1]|uniref:Uncharacterized protein n=1 Tax=Puccinia triticina (isolate 1-1 / race 1 (BBBD)) TaxID=630390 RepID=A0A180H0T8_PUCT1|nr:hypothetical protein PTTG_25610 [Puccinia triticina 1-1 BBBD Race 1]
MSRWARRPDDIGDDWRDGNRCVDFSRVYNDFVGIFGKGSWSVCDYFSKWSLIVRDATELRQLNEQLGGLTPGEAITVDAEPLNQICGVTIATSRSVDSILGATRPDVVITLKIGMPVVTTKDITVSLAGEGHSGYTKGLRRTPESPDQADICKFLEFRVLDTWANWVFAN